MPPGFPETLLNWLPAILLLAIYVFFLRRMSSRNTPAAKFQAAILEETRKQNQMLERIAAALEQRGG